MMLGVGLLTVVYSFENRCKRAARNWPRPGDGIRASLVNDL